MIVLPLILAACNNATDITESTEATDTNKFAAKTEYLNPLSFGIRSKDTLRTSGDREFYDSAHYHITRGYYISGALFIIAYDNKVTKLSNRKEFYENGRLKEIGVLTMDSHIPVGTWKYYAETGKLDSVVDYNKKYPVSCMDAITIAKNRGYDMASSDITLYGENGNTYWSITQWTINGHKGDGDVILINTANGNIQKRKSQLIID